MDEHPDAGRLRALGPDELDDDARRLYDDIVGGPRGEGPQHFVVRRDDGTLTGPFNVMLHAPAVGRPLAALGEALRFRSSLNHRWREVAILTVAAARRCGYEWYAHEPIGRAAGLDDATISALRVSSFGDRRETTPSLADPDDDLVRRVVLAVLGSRRLEPALHEEAEERLGSSTLVELVVLAGYYDTLAALVVAFDVGVPEGPEPFPTEGEPR